MNKRIRDLTEQCTTQYRDGHGGYIDQVDTEKFAELLINEVCKVLSGCVSVCYNDSGAIVYPSTEIRHHFRVYDKT